jgi:hypothetical protein
MTTLVALAATAATADTQVTAFPADPAEAAARAPRRTAELRFARAADARAAVELLDAQQSPYRPAAVTRSDRNVVVTYRPTPFS